MTSRVARFRTALLPLAAIGLALAAWLLSEPVLLTPFPALQPLAAHRLHTVLMCAALLAACVAVGRRAVGFGDAPAFRGLTLAWVAGLTVAAMYGVQAFYDGDWHEWSSVLRPGDAAIQRITLPAGWSMPPDARAEVRVYATGAREQTYVPVLSANGREIARLGPAFTEGGPLRFEERIMVTASQQGKVRAEVPQWYGLPLDAAVLQGSEVELRLTLEGAPDAWVRLWGDYDPQPGRRVLDAPSVHSRIQGQDDSFHKFVATGHPRLWRRFPLASPSAQAGRSLSGTVTTGDLSGAIGRQTGEYRLRVLVFGAAGDLLAIF